MTIGIEDLAYCMRIIREATEALDQVHAPRAPEQPSLVERIGLLAQQRDARARELERETEEAHRLSDLVSQFNQEHGTIERLLTDAGSPTNEPSQGIVWLACELRKRNEDLFTETNHIDALNCRIYEIMETLARAGIDTSVSTVEDGVSQLIGEREQLRRMHDGVSIDLDHERCKGQDALGEAAARELKLIEERDAAIQNAKFFRSEAKDCGAEIRELTKQRKDLSERYKHAIAQRDKAATDAGHAEGWRLQCNTSERTIERLTAKIKRLESQGGGNGYQRQIPKKTHAKGKKRRLHK